MWQSIRYPRRLLLQSALVFLIGIGFWRGNPNTVVQASTVYQNEDVPRFEKKKCSDVFKGTFPWYLWIDLSQSRFRCGYLITWKDYDLQEQGGTIRLAVMETFPTIDPKPAPVIWLAGGPGGNSFPKNPNQAKRFTKDFGRGWIQFSQRGTHLSRTEFSEAELLCDEYHTAIINNWEKQLDFNDWNLIKQEALKDCHSQIKNDTEIKDTTIIRHYHDLD